MQQIIPGGKERRRVKIIINIIESFSTQPHSLSPSTRSCVSNSIQTINFPLHIILRSCRLSPPANIEHHHTIVQFFILFPSASQRRSLSSPTPVTANTKTLPSPVFALSTHTSENWRNFPREFPLSLKVFSVFVRRRWKTDEMSQLKQQPHRQHDKLSVIFYDETKNESRFRSRVELSLHCSSCREQRCQIDDVFCGWSKWEKEKEKEKCDLTSIDLHSTNIAQSTEQSRAEGKRQLNRIENCKFTFSSISLRASCWFCCCSPLELVQIEFCTRIGAHTWENERRQEEGYNFSWFQIECLRGVVLFGHVFRFSFYFLDFLSLSLSLDSIRLAHTTPDIYTPTMETWENETTILTLF